MIGHMIERIRKEKNLSKTDLSKLTKIDIGHLTHIEKEERNPSHKTLKTICKALDIPYQNLMYTYDKDIIYEQEYYQFYNHISYNKILAIDNINSLIDCPSDIPGACLAVKMHDSSMEPKIKKDSYVFLELNTPLRDRDIGLVEFKGTFYIRKFIIRRDRLVLRPENKEYDEVNMRKEQDFTIIGKVVGIKK